MACATKANLLVFVSLLVSCLQTLVLGEPQVPCYFIFGDSLVDSGNNNHLNTTAKVDYSPYGIDFGYGPTGRFSNGRTAADVTGKLLGFDDFIPPYLNASGSTILKGVNYASGSAGIREETGKFMGDNIDLNKQLQYHQVTISRIVELLGNNKSAAVDLLNKCLYVFVIGSNDYINNYFVPQIYNTSKQYTPEKYAEVLIEQYSQYIKTLYNLGGRKVALTAIAPIGCTPNATATHNTNGSLCVDYMNEAANLFNDRLKSFVNQLNKDLTDAKFVYLNTYGVVSRYFSLPGIGIKVPSCCKVNQYGLCISGQDPCRLRDLNPFWDSFHPTETFNQIGARQSFNDLKKILQGN